MKESAERLAREFGPGAFTGSSETAVIGVTSQTVRLLDSQSRRVRIQTIQRRFLDRYRGPPHQFACLPKCLPVAAGDDDLLYAMCGT